MSTYGLPHDNQWVAMTTNEIVGFEEKNMFDRVLINKHF